MSLLISFAEGVWLRTAPARILGMRLTSTMTVLRLANGRLLLHSPVALTPGLRTAVEELGTVSHLYSPNLFHHLHIGDWAAAFPAAVLHAPPGLAKKRPDLRIDRVHGKALPAELESVVLELPIEGFRLEESALFYRPASTMVVADLVHNVGRPQHAWTGLYTRLMGFHDRVAMSRMIRWTAFNDRAAARRSIDLALAEPFDRLVVGHGESLQAGAREALTAAYSWLPASSS